MGAAISPLDRGFTYGDGVFETCRVRYGQVPLWTYHRERLLAGCHQLQIACIRERLDDYCNQLLALPEVSQAPNAVLKLIVTRGVGGRGYRLPGESTTTYCSMVFEGKPLVSANVVEGVQLRVCQARLVANASLAGLKHLNRLEQVLARSEWEDEYQEGLLLDARGYVIEATASNLFAVMGGQLMTPDLTESGVAGIMRQLIIEQLGPAAKLPLHITRFTLDALKNADEIFVCNSLVGIWPVCSIAFSPELTMNYKIGPVTRRLQSAIERMLSGS